MDMVFLVKMNIANNYKRSNISTILLSLSFIMILFIGLFSILYTITFGYSLSPSIPPYNSTDTTKFITNHHHQQQQMTPEVKNFILNDIVNKSKADYCCRLYRSKWYKVIQLWKYIKSK